MKTYNLALLGFGNVGRALAGLLKTKTAELRDRYGIGWKITGVASRRIGWLANPDGFDVDDLLAGNFQSAISQIPEAERRGRNPQSEIRGWLSASRADVLFENSSLNPHTGQPAIDYVKAGLEHGAHVVTANKGPVVHAYRELRDLAAAKGKRFLFEAAVMGGAPVFSLFREALPAANLKRFRGILNSTTNLILTEMEAGLSFEQAVKKAQDLGIAETDPSADVDGWDAAVKVSALATVLMDAPLKPQDVQREGIRGLTQEMVQAARRAGRPFKLVCQAARGDDGRVTASVRPEQVPSGDPLAPVNGASSIITFEMDTIYGLTLGEQNPDAITTAYGPLADFVTAVRDSA
jgi:homoserine dehydrogenase